MDSKDFHLLVGLLADGRQSYRALARSVSLSHPVVLERIRRLESQGILLGYWLLIDPSVFNRNDLLVWFERDWTHGDAMKALRVRDVSWVALKVDGDMTVQLWPEDRSQGLEVLSDTLRKRPAGKYFAERRNLRSLSAIDWQIIDVLIDDPRMPLEGIIDKTQLSPKTVRKHLRQLIRERIISIRPRLGVLANSGELVYTLSVFGRVEMAKLRQIIGDAFLVNQLHDPPAKYLLCRGSDLSEVTEKTRAIEKLPGVESVSITLNREQLFATGFVHTLVREQIHHLDNARRKIASFLK